MTTVFDIETDGLLDELTKIHVMSWSNDMGEVKHTHDYDEMRYVLLNSETLVGHNIIRFDIPAVEKVLGIKVKARLIDTLALSWYLHHDRMKHGLEGYGEDYGVPKPVIKDWNTLTPQEYAHRCDEDVKINNRLWRDLSMKLDKLYKDAEADKDRLIDYLTFKLDCAREQEALRWKLDVDKAQAAYDAALGTVAVAAGATPDTKAYSGYDLDVKVSGASDNGMTFSMGFDIGAGQIADSTDDLAMDNMGTTFVAEELVIGYNGYTVKIGDNLIDDLYDDSQNGDVSVSGTIGELSFGIVTDMDKDTAATTASVASFDNTTATASVYTAAVAAKAGVYETTSYSLGYKAGDVAFSLVGTDGNDAGEAAMKVSASAPLGDFKFTASIDNKGKADDIAKLAVSYTTGGMTLTASSADDANHSLNTNKDAKASYDVGLSYAMGDATVQYNTDESAAWWANASYNLGGGAAAFATIDNTDFAVAGVKFTF